MKTYQEQNKNGTKKADTTEPAPSSWRVHLKKQLRSLPYAEQKLQLKGGQGAAIEGVAKEGFGDGGGALPHQAEVESYFGADLSGVKAHTGVAAGAACETMGAKAYAYGPQVAFKDGAPSKTTIVHEIAHVLGGGEAQADAAEQSFGSGISTAPAQSVRSAPSPVQRKATPEQEEKLGEGIAEGMRDANTGSGLRYYRPDSDPKEYDGGKAPEKYWEKTGWYTFALKKAESASEAIDAMFTGPTILECLSTTKLIFMRSIKETIGAKAFDKAYGEKGKDNQSLIVTATGQSQLDEFLVSETIKPDDLKVGDWGYFHNHPKYLIKHPTGFWQGENAVYMGGGKWSGFGASGKTQRQMINALKGAYNGGRTSHDTDAIQSSIDRVATQFSADYSDATVQAVKKVYEDYYKDYPDTVKDADIPGIDEAAGMIKEVDKQLGQLELRRKHTSALVTEWAAKNKHDPATVQASVDADFTRDKSRLEAARTRAAAMSGKFSVHRLDADKVADMAPSSGG